MSDSNDRKRKELADDYQPAQTKRVKKLSSVIAKASDDLPKTTINHDSQTDTLKSEPKLKSYIAKVEKPVVNDILKNDDVLQRNKRMFAGIMGHLGRAKDRIIMDSSTLEKQSTIKAAISHKQVEDARIAAEHRRRIRDRDVKLVRISFRQYILMFTILFSLLHRDSARTERKPWTRS
jgi:hypothetical protein